MLFDYILPIYLFDCTEFNIPLSCSTSKIAGYMIALNQMVRKINCVSGLAHKETV